MSNFHSRCMQQKSLIRQYQHTQHVQPPPPPHVGSATPSFSHMDRRSIVYLLSSMAATAVTLPAYSIAQPAPQAAPSASTSTSSSTSTLLPSEAGLAEFMKFSDSPQANNVSKLRDLRSKYGFRRTAAGKVQVRGSGGQWYDVRLDMQLPGVCILRDPDGYVYALQLEDVKQIDLSNDWIVMSLFVDGSWEESLEPLTFGDEEEKLRMGGVEFRESLGILSEALRLSGFDEEEGQEGGK